MDRNEIRISTENNSGGITISATSSGGQGQNMIRVDSNDVRYYEKQAEKYATQAKENAKDCADNTSEAKKAVSDCKDIANSLDKDLSLHIADTDNPHNVTAEQLNVYTKDESDGKYLTEHQDISGKADKAEIPTKVSELENDRGYLSVVPDEYVTETELSAKGYLTEHQDISGKQDVIPDLETIRANASKVSEKQNIISDIDTIRTNAEKGASALQSVPDEYVTEEELTAKGYLSSVPAEYVTESDLSAKGYLSSVPDTYAKKTDIPDISGKADKTEIPTKVSELTNDSGYLTEHQDISGKANTADLATVATSGSYNDLSDKPIIPEGAVIDPALSDTSKNSVANSVVTKALKNKQDVISDIDTIRTNAAAGAAKQDKLTAGSGIDITNNVITNTQTSAEWGNIAGSIVNQTDLKSELDKKQDVISDLATIRANAATGAKALQSVPDEYVTETELSSKGYLTKHQDISGKQDKLIAGTGIKISYNVISSDLSGCAKTDMSNCTLPYIKETSQTDTSGYIMLSNNLCVQWGRLKKGGAIAKSGTWKGTVTLPKKYKDTNYTIIVSCNYGTGIASNAGSEVGTGAMTQTSFNFHMYNRNGSATANTIELNWITIGIFTNNDSSWSGDGGDDWG